MQEAADALGVHKQTIKRRVASGEIPSFKIGNRRLIPLALLDEMIERQIERGASHDGR